MDFKKRGAGGTPGGVGDFLFGGLLTIIGLYLLSRQVRVSTSFWGGRYGFFGDIGVSAFGVTMVVMMIGIGLIFFNGKSKTGWIITGLALLFTIVGIIANLNIYFAPTSLYVTVIILALIAGGLGLIFRGIRPFN